jgi:2-phosphosulfolactate phosphatase
MDGDTPFVCAKATQENTRNEGVVMVEFEVRGLETGLAAVKNSGGDGAAIPRSSWEGGFSMDFDQSDYDLRCEWGLDGLLALQPISDAVVIVDVLSFSTAVDIALSKGASILPYRWKDDSAKRFAAEKGAVLAAERSAEGYTLSPASLRSIPAQTLLVLPSPNGSALSLAANGIPTFTACLRNAPAVAKRAAACGSRIALIPAGERWREGSLRPCLEDLIGAGSVLAELPGRLSPEAELALAAFARFRSNLRETLLRSGSGKELLRKGFALDVDLAAEYSQSLVVPTFACDRFIDG